MSAVWISAIGLCGASVLGSLIGLLFKQMSHKWHDTIMGYCAGVMLAASVLGLILPASDMVGLVGGWQVVVGVIVGAMFLNLLDKVTPHLHHLTALDPEEHSGNSSINKVLLFVLAIAIHKLPEGVAVGVGFNNEVESDAWSVAIGIALQNVPEGMVVISPLLLSGVSRMRTLLISIAIGLLELVGVWIGYLLGGLSEMFLPMMLSFAGGAMLYVISDEMIPETHAHGYQKMATYALLLGFLTLLFMDKMV